MILTTIAHFFHAINFQLNSTIELDDRCKLFHTCPVSSNAITTTAAPNLLMILAFAIKSSSPSFKLMLFTIHLPLKDKKIILQHGPAYLKQYTRRS